MGQRKNKKNTHTKGYNPFFMQRINSAKDNMAASLQSHSIVKKSDAS